MIWGDSNAINLMFNDSYIGSQFELFIISYHKAKNNEFSLNNMFLISQIFVALPK